eukprot:TRINITY_DN50378_c0_g1_i1.p1 TRINITY_DN50378_c0_g1~~TRINITY_DN50378_c0_g1_i1.p1  ORF type:complete len:358 (+),score=16.20 TRINITY_DN50378_c0_g1_i1:118-1191(+)
MISFAFYCLFCCGATAFSVTDSLRTKFLRFYEERGHIVEEGAPIVTGETRAGGLFFTNAGVVPLLKYVNTRTSRRIATAQLCLRARGKQDDLEKIGRSKKHQTIFEMLGNFAFGENAYGRNAAISMAWDLLVNELKIDKSRLWVSVFKSDQETMNAWLSQTDLDKNHLVKLGKNSNWWSAGGAVDSPCGPCTEIFYDVKGTSTIISHDHVQDIIDDKRFIELWNIVFMEFRQLDKYGSRLERLEWPCVDTGMGLERLAAVMSDVPSTFDTESFRELTAEISRVITTPQSLEPEEEIAEIVADHVRTTAFLLCEGVEFASTGRGYVMRRILRRALSKSFIYNTMVRLFFRLLSIFLSF